VIPLHASTTVAAVLDNSCTHRFLRFVEAPDLTVGRIGFNPDTASRILELRRPSKLGRQRQREQAGRRVEFGCLPVMTAVDSKRAGRTEVWYLKRVTPKSEPIGRCIMAGRAMKIDPKKKHYQ